MLKKEDMKNDLQRMARAIKRKSLKSSKLEEAEGKLKESLEGVTELVSSCSLPMEGHQ